MPPGSPTSTLPARSSSAAPPTGSTPRRAAKGAGVRRARALAVGGAFHTPLMAPAADALGPRLDATTFARADRPDRHQPRRPAHTRPTGWPDRLRAHLVEPVRWEACERTLSTSAPTTLVEVGPGTTLTGPVVADRPRSPTRTSPPQPISRSTRRHTHERSRHRPRPPPPPRPQGDDVRLAERLVVAPETGVVPPAAARDGDGRGRDRARGQVVGLVEGPGRRSRSPASSPGSSWGCWPSPASGCVRATDRLAARPRRRRMTTPGPAPAGGRAPVDRPSLPARRPRVGPACPRRDLTNDDLAQSLDTSDDWIAERTGIRSAPPRRPRRDHRRAGHRRRPRRRSTVPGSPAGRRRPRHPGHRPPRTGSCPATAATVAAGSAPAAPRSTSTPPAPASSTRSTWRPRCCRRRASTTCSSSAPTASPPHRPDDRSTAVLFGDGAGAVVLARAATPTPTPPAPACSASTSAATAGAVDVLERRRTGERTSCAWTAARCSAGPPAPWSPRPPPRSTGPARRPTTSTLSCPTRPTSASSTPPPTGSASRRTGRRQHRPLRQHVGRLDPPRPAPRPPTTAASADGDLVLLVRHRRRHGLGHVLLRWGRRMTPTTSPVALVTGGSGGIGAATALALAAAGHHVAVGYRADADGAKADGRGHRGRRRRGARGAARRHRPGLGRRGVAQVEDGLRAGRPSWSATPASPTTACSCASPTEQLAARARHQPRRRLPRHQAGGARHDAGAGGAHRHRLLGRRPTSAPPGRPTTPRPRPA